MQRALIIYDNTGRIYSIIYGEDTTPQGIPCMYADIPEGAQLERIDITDPKNPQPVYSYLPETELDRLQSELTDTQLALAGIYEMLITTGGQ